MTPEQRTRLVQLVPVPLDPEGRIETDVSCRSCGYNIRSQSAAGFCSECGYFNYESARNHMWLLCNAEPHWLRGVARGALLIAATVLAAFPVEIGIWSLAGGTFGVRYEFISLVILAWIVLGGLAVRGVWLATAPQRHRLPEVEGLRRNVRILLISGIGLALLAEIANWVRNYVMFADLLGTSVLASWLLNQASEGLLLTLTSTARAGFWIAVVALAAFWTQLLRRALAPRAAQAATWLTICIGACGVIIFANGITPLSIRLGPPLESMYFLGALLTTFTLSSSALVVMTALILWRVAANRRRSDQREAEPVHVTRSSGS